MVIALLVVAGVFSDSLFHEFGELATAIPLLIINNSAIGCGQVESGVTVVAAYVMVHDTQFLFVVIEVVACDAEALGCLFPHIYFIAADADNDEVSIIGFLNLFQLRDGLDARLATCKPEVEQYVFATVVYQVMSLVVQIVEGAIKEWVAYLHFGGREQIPFQRFAIFAGLLLV